MPDPTIPFPAILAAFTQARRKFMGLSPSALARRLGIRTDQVRAAEDQKRIGATARAALVRFNRLEAWADG